MAQNYHFEKIRMREFATEIVEPKNITYHFSENVAEGLTLDADKRKNLFLILKRQSTMLRSIAMPVALKSIYKITPCTSYKR